jgi:hypothetical protein
MRRWWFHLFALWLGIWASILPVIGFAGPNVLDPLNSQDPDLIRMKQKGVLDASFATEIEYSVEDWTDAKGKTWRIQKISTKSAPNPTFFLPHDNEDMALETALRYLKKHRQGTLVFLFCGEQRRCGNVDPNRNFCARDFNEKIFSYFSEDYPIVALHNNENGCTHNGGSGNVSAKFPYSGAEGFMRGGDEDDLLIHNGMVPPTGLNLILRNFAILIPFNEIYENAKGDNDCSMSFAASYRGRFYYNVEAEERSSDLDGYTVQLKMLEDTLAEIAAATSISLSRRKTRWAFYGGR